MPGGETATGEAATRWEGAGLRWRSAGVVGSACVGEYTRGGRLSGGQVGTSSEEGGHQGGRSSSSGRSFDRLVWGAGKQANSSRRRRVFAIVEQRRVCV